MLKLNLISLSKGPIKGALLCKYVSARMGYVQRHRYRTELGGLGQLKDSKLIATQFSPQGVSARQLLYAVNLTHG
jgi:hypothetical protein